MRDQLHFLFTFNANSKRGKQDTKKKRIKEKMKLYA